MRATLSRITISNYKSIFHPQTIDFNVTTTDVVGLYGRNAVGKSNILMALKTITEIMLHSGDVDYRLPYDYFHYLNDAAVQPTMFGIEVSDKRYTMSYSFAYNAKEIVYEALKLKSQKTNKFKVLFSRQKKELTNPSAANYGFSQKLIERTLPRTLLLTKAYEDNNSYAVFVLDVIKRIEFVSMESSRIESKASTILSEKPMIKDKVLNVLQDIDSGIKDIQTSSVRVYDSLLRELVMNADLSKELLKGKYVNVKIVREYGGTRYAEDISDESSGVRAIITALTMIQYAFENDLMLCIDEFGNYMHPHIAKKIIHYYNSLLPKNKLLITTHQIDLYDYIGRTERIIVGRDDDSGETILEQRKKTTSLRKLKEERKDAGEYFVGMIKKSKNRVDMSDLFKSFIKL